jgi:uncharacterized membrane protein YdbT with pleckstrin-like domain
MRTRFRCVCLSSVSRLHNIIAIKTNVVFFINFFFFIILVCSRHVFYIVLCYVLHVFAPDCFALCLLVHVTYVT